MKILAFSDLHTDLAGAADLVNRSAEVDLVVGAGDFASQHRGLEETLEVLEAIETPTLLVPGNNETEHALRKAAEPWKAARVLHGDGTEIDGISFWGLGAGVPTTPWGWSFDLSEEEATDALADCPDGGVMILHSPPKGHCDQNAVGTSLGSNAILDAIEAKQPRLAVFGHIHESWGSRSKVGETDLANLGPEGATFEIS